MTMKRVLLIACTVLVCTSCGGQKKRKTAGTETATETAATLPPAPVEAYVVPEIPAMLTDPESRARWAVEHYWDNFNFKDTVSVENWSAYAEQAFVDFDYQLLANIPSEVGGEAITVLFGKAQASKDVFLKFAEVAEKYLFDPNSPYRNEDLYIATLNSVLANPALDEWERIRPQDQLRLAMKNRVGDRAADFRYTLDSGATGTLNGLRAKYTLLFFNNPGCPACRDLMDQISASPFLSNLIGNGTLTVLAVYTDEDLAAWREYLPQMPEGWISSYDAAGTIKSGELYDLKAIPTIYLLDSSKRVMLKDIMSVPLIEQTINSNEQK
jgi:hypothetical protein